jgi:hypothetical protein
VRSRLVKGKKIPESFTIGQQGVNLIERVVLEMGFLWHPSGPIEAGIDGIIEVRDPDTGAALNSIIQVQSKATLGSFVNETDASFEYLCDPKDLDYWLNGNAPVILVISRPSTGEAYWVSIKDYFAESETRASRKIKFGKHTNRFDEACKSALLELAIPRDSGIYFSPSLQREKLYSNLLTVSYFAERLYIAETDFRKRGQLWSELERLGGTYGSEWLLKEKRIYSFHNLREFPWSKVCDPGTTEEFDSSEWAFASDLDRRRDFVQLLNLSLREKVKIDLAYSKSKDCYYFKATTDLSERRISYNILRKMRRRRVFMGYPSKRDPTWMAYYRHSAFTGHFRCFGSVGYLEITPTYYFTRDGYQFSRYSEDRLSGIKRLERNPNVYAQLLTWAWYLTKPEDMFSAKYPFLKFGDLQLFELDAGINDEAWLGREEAKAAELIKSSLRDLPLFQQ